LLDDEQGTIVSQNLLKFCYQRKTAGFIYQYSLTLARSRYLYRCTPFITIDFCMRFVYSVLFLFILFLYPVCVEAQADTRVGIARIQYRGGGDWYNDPSSLRNLMTFSKEYVPISLKDEYDDIALGSRDLHRYPFAFMTGHGTMAFNEAELENVRSWLDNGGFLYIDDDYGFDDAAREFISRLYPAEELIELPLSHP